MNVSPQTPGAGNAAAGLAKAAADCGAAFVSDVSEVKFDSALLSGMPVTWAREHAVLPVGGASGDAFLLVPGPEALPLLQRASLAAGCDLAPAFAERGVILAAVDAAYFEAKSPDAAPAAETPQPAGPAGSAPSPSPAPADSAEDLLVERGEPAARILNETVLAAVRQGASDVHFEPSDSGGARVRFRISGRLYDREPAVPAPLGAQVVSRIKVMGGMDIAEHRLPQDGMTRVRAGGRAVDVRISTVPVADGERVVLRLLDRGDSMIPLPDLGMDGDVLHGFSALLSRPNGIVAVCGPTGSGKTTTLYAAIRSLDVRRRNIVTIEDPVEYRIDGISQIQVRPRIGLTFASGLRSVLRQDPDVVLVGETRDPETAEIAVRASLTGHLVLTTLHTNDAPSAVMRLVDMGVEPYLLASSLRGVLAQRLVRRLCPHCSRTAAYGESRMPAAEEALARAAGCGNVGIADPRGCRNCLEGYSGRIGIFELLPCEGAVSEAIHAGRLASGDLRAAAAASGAAFSPMSADAAAKLRAGVTTPSEVLAALGDASL